MTHIKGGHKMEKRKEIIERLIIDHMNIIRDLASLLDSDIDYMAMCYIKHNDNEEKDFYSFNATANHESIITFNKFI